MPRLFYAIYINQLSSFQFYDRIILRKTVIYQGKKLMHTFEEMLLNRNFSYEPPYFYNNDFALRCELGMGGSNEEYLANAKKRAAAIFSVLFENDVDMFFFDNYIYDFDFDMGNTVYIKNLISLEKKRLNFCLSYQKKFKHVVIRNIPYDKEDDDDIVRRNRICCYPNKNFNAIKVINSQIDNQENPIIHLVSFENSCIFTVYDDRGCDIVFFDKNKFRHFYPLLQKYFLDYDIALMKKRLVNSTNMT